MEPIPESQEAVDEFGPFTEADGGDLLTELLERSEQVRTVVPDCVGISVASMPSGVTFTVVATSAEIALLDAVQYVAGGPCLSSTEVEAPVTYTRGEVLDEQQWRLFAQATAARSILSTLTLPVLSDGAVVGSINLYAASSRAFDTHHGEVAAIFDAWAPGAATNADLGFMTRDAAQHAPEQLREEVDIEVAAGMVARTFGLDAPSAHQQLVDASTRAGVHLAALARLIIRAQTEPTHDQAAPGS